MKYANLSIGDKFTLVSDDSGENCTVYEKVTARGASCCTPGYNSTYVIDKTQKMRFMADKEIVKLFLNAEALNSTIGSLPENTTKTPEVVVVAGFQSCSLTKLAFLNTVFRYQEKKYKKTREVIVSGAKQIVITNIEDQSELTLSANTVVDIYEEDNN